MNPPSLKDLPIEIIFAVRFRNTTAEKRAHANAPEAISAAIHHIASEMATIPAAVYEAPPVEGEPAFTFSIRITFRGDPLAATHGEAADPNDLVAQLHAAADDFGGSLALAGTPGSKLL
jgi:hypothetical protein